MNVKSIIGILSGAVALFWYKSALDAEYNKLKKEFDKERQEYVDEIAERDAIINPNGSVNNPPVAIVGSVTMGGLTLNMLEIELTIKNYSDVDVELGDWRCRLTVGGVVSERVIPASLLRVKIPANKTRVVRLYARGDEAFPSSALIKEVKFGLLNGASLTKGTMIPAELTPAELDISVLWYWSGGEKEAHIFDVPCSFYYPYAGWTVGVWVGYNAGNKNQQDMNPSYWEKYDTHASE